MTNDSIAADFDVDPTLRIVRGFDANAREPAAATSVDADAPADAAFEGPTEFARVLYAALRHAQAVGARRIAWCDEDFAAWPLGEGEWVRLLTRWARAGTCELVMVAGGYQAIERLHPRFIAWRRDFAHVVRCLVREDEGAGELPTLWIDGADQVVNVFDRERLHGRAGFDRVDRQHVREEFDAIAQRASPGFAAATLGL